MSNDYARKILEINLLRFREAEDSDGKWITIRGTHVLIKDGETPSQAFERTTGKKLTDYEKGIYDKPKSTDTNAPKNINSGSAKDNAGDNAQMNNQNVDKKTFDKMSPEEKGRFQAWQDDQKQKYANRFSEDPDLSSYDAPKTKLATYTPSQKFTNLEDAQKDLAAHYGGVQTKRGNQIVTTQGVYVTVTTDLTPDYKFKPVVNAKDKYGNLLSQVWGE